MTGIKVMEDGITKYIDERHGGWFATDRRTARFFGPRIGTTNYYICSIICSFVSEPSQRSVKLRLMPDKANPDAPSLMGYMPPKMHESTVRDSLTVLRAFGLIATTTSTGNRGETVYELLDSRRAKAAILAKEAQRNLVWGRGFASLLIESLIEKKTIEMPLRRWLLLLGSRNQTSRRVSSREPLRLATRPRHSRTMPRTISWKSRQRIRRKGACKNR